MSTKLGLLLITMGWNSHGLKAIWKEIIPIQQPFEEEELWFLKEVWHK